MCEINLEPENNSINIRTNNVLFLDKIKLRHSPLQLVFVDKPMLDLWLQCLGSMTSPVEWVAITSWGLYKLDELENLVTFALVLMSTADFSTSSWLWTASFKRIFICQTTSFKDTGNVSRFLQLPLTNMVCCVNMNYISFN